jgi:hypothetical protein
MNQIALMIGLKCTLDPIFRLDADDELEGSEEAFPVDLGRINEF